MNNIKPFTKKTRWLSIYFLVIWMYGMLLGACTSIAPTSIAENIPVENQNEATPIAEVQPTKAPSPTSTMPPSPTPTEVPPTLRQIAEGVVAEVGVIIDVLDGNPERIVYVFEERHHSILDQIEIAIMFNRLYIEQDMRHIGLEGVTTEKGVMDLAWAHHQGTFQPDQFITSREDVLVQMAQDGVLNNAELIGLIYNDVVIHGVDDADLYAVTVENPSHWYLPYDYNYQIALMMMAENDFKFWQELMGKNEIQMAYNYAMNTSPYAQEMIERLQSDLSAETFIELLDELVAKGDEEAQKRGLNMNEKLVAVMSELHDYMDVVVARSEAMANTVINLLDANPGAPMALTVGNMHGDRIVEMLADAGVSVVWVHPLALAEGNDIGVMSDEAYERYEQGYNPSPSGTLGAFLDGLRKPTPLGEKPATKKEAQLRQLFQELMKLVWDLEYDRSNLTPEQMEERVENFVNDWNTKQMEGSTWLDFSTPPDFTDKFLFHPGKLPILHTPENTAGLKSVELEITLITGQDVDLDSKDLSSFKELVGTLSFRPSSTGKGEKTLVDRLTEARSQVQSKTQSETEITDGRCVSCIREECTNPVAGETKSVPCVTTTQDICGDTQVTWKTQG